MLGEIEEIRHSYYDDESWIVFPDGPSRSLQFNYRWEEVHDQGEIIKFLVMAMSKRWKYAISDFMTIGGYCVDNRLI